MTRHEATEQFMVKTMRHLAQLRTAGPEDLGAMTMLLGMTSYHRARPLGQVMHSLETPLRLRQYRIFRTADGFPRAFITWAGLTPEAERRFAVDHQPLASEDWNAGGSKWVVDLAAPFGQIEQMFELMSASKQAQRLRTLWHNKDGTRARVIEWSRNTQKDDIRVCSYGEAQFEKLLRSGG